MTKFQFFGSGTTFTYLSGSKSAHAACKATLRRLLTSRYLWLVCAESWSASLSVGMSSRKAKLCAHSQKACAKLPSFTRSLQTGKAHAQGCALAMQSRL